MTLPVSSATPDGRLRKLLIPPHIILHDVNATPWPAAELNCVLIDVDTLLVTIGHVWGRGPTMSTNIQRWQSYN